MSGPMVISDPGSRTVVVLREPARPGLVIAGFRGPAGANGNGSAFVFNQPAPAAAWTINHNLGYRPQCTLFDAGNSVFLGEIQHPSVNQAVVQLVTPMAGSARLQ